jgi:hypothetical protein
VLLLVQAALAEHALHYRLSPGDQLVYELRETTMALDDNVAAGLCTGRNEPRGNRTEQIQVWCLRRAGQELLILVAALGAGDGPSQPLTQRAPEGGADREAIPELRSDRCVKGQPLIGLPFYMDEAGRPRWPEEVRSRAGDLENALVVIPRLPLAVESDAFWLTGPDLWGQQWRCWNRGPRPEPATPASEPGRPPRTRLCIEFTAENRLGSAEVWGLECAGRFWFDPLLGCMTRIEVDETNRLRATRTHLVAVLRQKLTNPPAWATRRADEAQRYLRTLRHEDRLLHDLAVRGEELPQTMEQFDRLWAAFKSDVDGRSGSPLAGLADARRQWLRRDAEVLRARAVLGRRWMNQPARPWSLQDPNGRTLTSESLRQSIVIECLWSAESTWGLRALESFRQTQARVAAGVRVLCYNMDSDPVLAASAIRHCGAGLTHVLAGPLQDVEGLTEFPVVRVLDAKGIVRDLSIGWQPEYTSAREMAETLRKGDAR